MYRTLPDETGHTSSSHPVFPRMRTHGVDGDSDGDGDGDGDGDDSRRDALQPALLTSFRFKAAASWRSAVTRARSQPRVTACWLLTVLAWLCMSIVAIVYCVISYQSPFLANTTEQHAQISTPRASLLSCASVDVFSNLSIALLNLTDAARIGPVGCWREAQYASCFTMRSTFDSTCCFINVALMIDQGCISPTIDGFALTLSMQVDATYLAPTGGLFPNTLSLLFVNSSRDAPSSAAASDNWESYFGGLQWLSIPKWQTFTAISMQRSIRRDLNSKFPLTTGVFNDWQESLVDTFDTVSPVMVDLQTPLSAHSPATWYFMLSWSISGGGAPSNPAAPGSSTGGVFQVQVQTETVNFGFLLALGFVGGVRSLLFFASEICLRSKCFRKTAAATPFGASSTGDSLHENGRDISLHPSSRLPDEQLPIAGDKPRLMASGLTTGSDDAMSQPLLQGSSSFDS